MPEKSLKFAELAAVWTNKPRRRLYVPREIWQVANWASEELPITLLAVLDEPGALHLRRREIWDQKIAPRVEKLSAGGDSDGLFLLLDRYQLVTIGTDLRFSPSEKFVGHLGLPISQPSHIYFEASAEFIRIMSSGFRNARLLQDLSELLDD